MRYGMMCGFRGDMLPELSFARDNYDFAEITLMPADLKNMNYLGRISKATEGLEVVGHLHWDLTDFEEITTNIRFLSGLGAKRITIHPFARPLEENAAFIRSIADVCNRYGAILMIENVTAEPYNRCSTIKQLLDAVPSAGFTLDVGHASKCGELDQYLNVLGHRITHVHLHDNVGNIDHLFYRDAEKLRQDLRKLKDVGFDETVNLETFAVYDNKPISVTDPIELSEKHRSQIIMLQEGTIKPEGF